MSAIEMANLMRRLREPVRVAWPPATDPASTRCRSCSNGTCASSRSMNRHCRVLRQRCIPRRTQCSRERDEFLEQLVRGTVEKAGEIDALISSHAEHWRIERMPAVDRNILRLAIYEMRKTDTPPAVVIDEALELARRFSTEESVQFVNGVLDAVHKEGSRC